jgi:hypothetical protein
MRSIVAVIGSQQLHKSEGDVADLDLRMYPPRIDSHV